MAKFWRGRQAGRLSRADLIRKRNTGSSQFVADDFFDTAASGKSAAIVVTLDSVSVAASGAVGHEASGAVTLDGCSVSITAAQASSVANHPATVSVALDAVTVGVEAKAGKSAAASVSLGDITVGGAASAGRVATSSLTLDSVAQNAAATAGRVVSIAVSVDGVNAQAEGVVSHSSGIEAQLSGVSVSVTATNSAEPVKTGGGAGGRAKKYWIEVGGKVLIFASADDAEEYIAQQAKQGKPKQQRIKPTVKPVYTVERKEIVRTAKRYQYEAKHYENFEGFDRLIAIYAAIAKRDEEDVEFLLLAA